MLPLYVVFIDDSMTNNVYISLWYLLLLVKKQLQQCKNAALWVISRLSCWDDMLLRLVFQSITAVNVICFLLLQLK